MTYAPTADFNGTGGFDYTLDNGIEQISGSVAINVDAVNDAPTITPMAVAQRLVYLVAENTSAVTTVTATDPDAPGDTRFLLRINGGADATNSRWGDSSTGGTVNLHPPRRTLNCRPTSAGITSMT